MKTLQTIQTLSKIGKIVSKIVFVCCIVGFCLCAAGILSVAVGVPAFKLGGVTLDNFLHNEAGLSTGTLYASMTAGAITCAGQAVLAKFASRYFGRELTDGTPFTLGGANELLRLGILSICVPVGMQAASEIALKIFTKVFTDVEPPESSPAASVAVGVLVLVVALICKYGAELTAEKPSDER